MSLDDDNWLMDDEADSAAAKSDPWHVLVVDDEPDIHHVTRLALTNIDFLGRPLNIISCYTGQEALALLR